jgi:D-tyrosyl-tRNA(Tyr) deacylase
MKAVVQRVTRARVTSDGVELGSVGAGMLVLLGVMRGDTEREARSLADKVARFRFFRDDEDRMNRSALDVGAAALVVSQFTLAADGKKGRRPSFDRAAPPEIAEPLYELFVAELRALGLAVATGRFGARMEVELVNDGPVTFVLEEAPEAPAGSAS